MRDLITLDKYRLKDMERKLYGASGDGGNGIFTEKMPTPPKIFV